jgi:hypothetical protein
MARNRHILHTPMEWMNERNTFDKILFIHVTLLTCFGQPQSSSGICKWHAKLLLVNCIRSTFVPNCADIQKNTYYYYYYYY